MTSNATLEVAKNTTANSTQKVNATKSHTAAPSNKTLVQLREYPQPDIRGPMPVNAHPDSTFSSHVHNDWTYAQLSAQEYPGENVQNLAQGYEGMFRQDNRMFPEFED